MISAGGPEPVRDAAALVTFVAFMLRLRAHAGKRRWDYKSFLSIELLYGSNEVDPLA
jgi:hypothetical protein